MVRNFTSRPTVKFIFTPDNTNCPGVVWYGLRVNARDRKFWAKTMKADLPECSPEVQAKFNSLSAAYYPAYEAMSVVRAKCPGSNSVSLPAFVPRHVRAEWDLVDAAYGAVVRELQALMETIATPDFIKRATLRAIIIEADKGDDGRSFALYRGAVWVCNRPLTAAQWQLLVNRRIQREESKLACALAGASATSQTRERLSDEVRHAVWIRDQGKCARCGKRERLEYDHIVPVSRGGSNTERNIELLCEGCNRAKSDSII